MKPKKMWKKKIFLIIIKKWWKRFFSKKIKEEIKLINDKKIAESIGKIVNLVPISYDKYRLELFNYRKFI